MLLSRLLTSVRPPSAVLMTLVASWLLEIAWLRPVICACRLLEIIRPAGSSAAVLMRKPLDRRSMLVLTFVATTPRLRKALSAVTLVLICNPITVGLLHDLPVGAIEDCAELRLPAELGCSPKGNT